MEVATAKPKKPGMLLDHMLANRQLSLGYDCPASSVRRSLKSSEDVER